MTWSKTPPTAPGFYWARSGAVKEREIVESVDGGMYWLFGHDSSMPESYMKRWSYEFWDEPIPPPEHIDTWMCATGALRLVRSWMREFPDDFRGESRRAIEVAVESALGPEQQPKDST